MPEYSYYNSMDNKVSTTTKINFCAKQNGMSFCKAVELSDQHGCKYREDASKADRCMYWRKEIDGACDCIWAQKSIDKPS